MRACSVYKIKIIILITKCSLYVDKVTYCEIKLKKKLYLTNILQCNAYRVVIRIRMFTFDLKTVFVEYSLWFLVFRFHFSFH